MDIKTFKKTAELSLKDNNKRLDKKYHKLGSIEYHKSNLKFLVFTSLSNLAKMKIVQERKLNVLLQ